MRFRCFLILFFLVGLHGLVYASVGSESDAIQLELASFQPGALAWEPVPGIEQYGFMETAARTSAAPAKAKREGMSGKAQVKRVVGFLLNYFIGFGVGSYVQGDTGTGALITVLECVGIAGYAAGYIVLGGTALNMYGTGSSSRTSSQTNATLMSNGVIAIACVGVGSALMLTGNIIGLIAPWTYDRRTGYQAGATDPDAVNVASLPQAAPYVTLVAGAGGVAPAIGLRLSM